MRSREVPFAAGGKDALVLLSDEHQTVQAGPAQASMGSAVIEGADNTASCALW